MYKRGAKVVALTTPAERYSSGRMGTPSLGWLVLAYQHGLRVEFENFKKKAKGPILYPGVPR